MTAPHKKSPASVFELHGRQKTEQELRDRFAAAYVEGVQSKGRKGLERTTITKH